MFHPQVRRSLVAGGIMVVADAALVGKGMGGSVTDGAVLALSAYGCDSIHNVLEIPTTMVSSAICTGAIYTIAKSVAFGDNNFVMNYLMAAAVDAVTDSVNGMLPPMDSMGPSETAPSPAPPASLAE